MKTRFSSLVKLRKNTMDKSERVLQKANLDLNNASSALKKSYDSIEEISSPKNGSMSKFLASRTLLMSARNNIEHNKEWVRFAQNQVLQAKEKLKSDMMEHEKYKYLELQEVQKEIKKIKLQEAKDLDEIALMTHAFKGKN